MQLALEVQDPNNPLTKEKAEERLREMREIGGRFKQLSEMGLTVEGQKRAFPLLQRKQMLQKQIDKSTDKAIVKKQREEITELDKQLEDISRTYDFNTVYERGVAEAQARVEAEGKGFFREKTWKSFQAKMKEKGKDLSDEEAQRSAGFRFEDGDVLLNEEIIKDTKTIPTALHELLHGVTAKQLKITGQQSENLVKEFKQNLTKKEMNVLSKWIEDRYDTDPERATSEEWFNAMSDAIVDGELKYNGIRDTKIGKWVVENILRPAGFSNAQLGFKTGRQVYNFLKEYGQQSRGIQYGTQEGFTGDVKKIVDAEIDVEKGAKGKGEFSLIEPRKATELAKQYKDDPGSANIEQLLQQYRNLAFKALGYDRRKGDVDPQEAQSFVDSQFDSIMRRYDGSTEFSTWVTSNIKPKRQEFYESQIGDKAQTTSIDSDKARQVADTDTETKDTRTEREIRQDERAGIKARTKIPKVYNIDKVVQAIRGKAKGKDLTTKNIKQLKGFALEEISMMIGRDEALGKSIFKKISQNKDLNKAEMLAIQKFINVDSDFAKSSLLEGYTSEFKATGVVNKLLDKFYNKRSIRAKTGPGLKVQIKKPNIDLKEFKEAFGIIGKDQANWNQKVVASKGGVSDILKGFVRNLDQVISSQEIREQLIADGKPIEALRTLRDGIPAGLFSRTAKNQPIETQMALAEVMLSDEFLGRAEYARVHGNQNWFGNSLVDVTSREWRKTYDLSNAKLRTIGAELQQEFDPKKSWRDYVKKAVKIQLDEAKIGMYSTLKQIAKARGIDIDTGTNVYLELDNINNLRSEITPLLEDLKNSEFVNEETGKVEKVTADDINKYILPSLYSSYKMGRYKLKDNRKAPNLNLTEGELFLDKGNPRPGVYASATDAKVNTDVESDAKINKQIYAHDAWYNQKLSRDQQKKYGVKFFDDLPLNKRSEFVKNEIQPEGLRAKNVLNAVTHKMVELVKEDKLSAQTAAVFIELQFARMDGLGKLASDVRFIPVNTKDTLNKIFKLPKVKRGTNKDGSDKYIEDPFVLEHTIPGNRIKLAMYNAVLGGDKASMDLFESELAQYHSAIIPYAFDSLVNRKDGRELYLRTAPAIRQAGDYALSKTGRYADKSRFPMSLYDVDTKETFGEPIELEETIEEARESNNKEGGFSKIITNANQGGKIIKTNADLIQEFANMDEALNKARALNQPIKKARIFDFDDTIARTKSKVYATREGEKKTLTAEEFAKDGEKLEAEGWKMDFSDFNKVVKGKKGPLFSVMKRMSDAEGKRDLFILTARSPEAAPAIKQFLNKLGINIPLKNIIGLGNSTGKAKAQWIVNKAAEGYNDFYFADDAIQNVEAVNKVLTPLDVKSKIQQAKGKFSMTTKKDLKWEESSVGDLSTTFELNNKNYKIDFYPIDMEDTDYNLEFELETKEGATQEITGTGDAIKVISVVYNGLLKRLKKMPNVERIAFVSKASEESRVKVYNTLMEKLANKLGWDTDIWTIETFGKLESYEFELTKPLIKAKGKFSKVPSPVRDVLNVVDVKGETQQNRIRTAQQLDNEFNKLLEETSGIGAHKRYSAARAQTIGASKGKWKFWIPYSAEDFMGLIYPTLTKGDIGDKQMAWYKENVLDPYARAMNDLSRDRVQLMNDFRVLKNKMKVPKDLKKKAFDEFTNEQALRIYIWNLQGQDIPGVSKRDIVDAKKAIEKNSKLKIFAEELININKGDGYPAPTSTWLAGTITTDLINGLNTTKRVKYLEQWQENVDAIYNKDNLNKLEAIYGAKYVEALKNMLTRMKTGKNRLTGGNRLSNRIMDYINGSIGAIMFFNTRSAVLQTISSINFINWSDNNPAKAGLAFANQKQYWSDFKELMNSDFLVDRRNGLRLNISENEIADAAKTAKNKSKAALNWLLQKGYLPTQFADSFAIASGGATFYRNRINTYKKQGLSDKEAKAKAYKDFREIAEESQQSSRPDRISQQQASPLGRVLLAFANTPMQYARLTKRAYQDLINGRGDAKSNISKIIYYTFVQNVIFNALQQAVFAIGFGDDDEDKQKEDKYVDVANGMLDSVLRGLGIGGQAVSVGKNFLLDIYERSQRSRPAYADSVFELMKFSPPISSKISKLRQAAWHFESKKKRQEIIDKGFSLDNPAYEAGAKVITATTNLPLDRLYNKFDNIEHALAADTDTWMRLALLGGWPTWQLESKKPKKTKSSTGGYKSTAKRKRKRVKRKRRKRR